MLVWGITMVCVFYDYPELMYYYILLSRLCMGSLQITQVSLVRDWISSGRQYYNMGTGLRFLLGLAEAGLYPGVVFYMSWCVQ